jgi:hypothetical protein
MTENGLKIYSGIPHPVLPNPEEKIYFCEFMEKKREILWNDHFNSIIITLWTESVFEAKEIEG